MIETLRKHGALTRAALAERAGLSRATISIVLRDLLTMRAVCEEPQAGPRDRGRPSTLIRLDPRRVDLVGVEVGRAHVAVAIADRGDAIVGLADQPVDAGLTIEQRTRVALDLLDQVARSAGADLGAVRAAAVGTPGPSFGQDGFVTADLALTRTTRDRTWVGELVQRTLGCPVEVGNNTRFTALGVAGSETGSEAKNLVYLRLDHGIGGGAVLDGRLLHGQRGASGEFGHICVDPRGERCPCGGRGCLELIASVPALLRVTRTTDGDGLFRAVSAGRHRRALLRAAAATAQALAGLMVGLDCPVAVLGGTVAELPGFLEMVGEMLHEIEPSWAAAESSLLAAQDDHGAGARGALVHARTVSSTPTTMLVRR